MRILHVSQPTVDGVALVVQSLVHHQLLNGDEVFVASPVGDLSRALADGPAHWVRWDSDRRPFATLLSEARQLAHIIASVSPDVIHLHSSKAGLIGRLVIRGRIPTMFQPHAWSFEATHGLQQSLSVSWERFAARWTHTLVACSTDELNRGLAHKIRTVTRVALNGVDLPRVDDLTEQRQRVRRELGLDAETPVVGILGRLCEQKGQDIALAAWPAIRAAVPDAVLLIAGEGPDAGFLQAIAPHGVHFLGYRTDPTAVMAACDVIASPSRWEGLSLAVLEAMACARPVVASDVGGARQTLGERHGDTAGIVVPTGSATDLADAVLTVLNDRALAAAYAMNARRRAAATYSSVLTAEAVYDVVRALCGNAGAEDTSRLPSAAPARSSTVTAHVPMVHVARQTRHVATDRKVTHP